MKVIKSQNDIEALFKAGFRDKVIQHVTYYFKHILEVYGADYDPHESGWIVLLEDGDPLNDQVFLEEKLGVRGSRNLVSIIKEFVDYDCASNLFDVFVLYNDEFGMTFMIPNENWIGEELAHQLRTFSNE